jgi:hypothetical protein
MTAVAPVYDAANNLSHICLTSIYDVAKFVVRSLDIPQWPVEMSMCGDRMSVNALIELVKTCRGIIKSVLRVNSSLTCSRSPVASYCIPEPSK